MLNEINVEFQENATDLMVLILFSKHSYNIHRETLDATIVMGFFSTLPKAWTMPAQIGESNME